MPGPRRLPDRGARSVGSALVRWFRRHRRPLPWRRARDPYRIWVAEVLLQQTRVAQAIPFFERFVERFPSVDALAAAPLAEVLRLWAGAGYYARARNLHAAARAIVHGRGGQFPEDEAEWERLPGVGRYIARAVASLAYGRPVVAFEANGLRVAARWTLERGNLATSVVRRRLEAALALTLPVATAGEFNEAVMELGETVCTPVRPRCGDCPVAAGCRARAELDDPGSIPIRRSRTPRPTVRAAIVVLTDPRGRWLVQRRPPRGLLGGLWEFPGGKLRGGERAEAAARRELREETGLTVGPLTPLGVVDHAYSHFAVRLHVFQGRAPANGGPPQRPGRRWVRPSDLRRLPIPKATEKIVRRLEGAGTASPGSGPRPDRTSSSPHGAIRRRPVRAPVRRTDA